MSQQPEDGVLLKGFESATHGPELASFISALESFDAIDQMQELKTLGIERTGVGPGMRVLDVGCGFGLQTLRLARLVQPGGATAGCDLSPEFLAEASRRAGAAGLSIDFQEARAEALPYPDGSFDVLWSERLLIYISGVQRALTEMRRVLRTGGRLASIEPDISTTTLNLTNRALVRRVMGHEADSNVAHGWLPGQLSPMLRDVGFQDLQLATRVAVFPQDLATSYFSHCGQSAAADGIISESELQSWDAGIRELHQQGNLFATVGYFLLTARC